MSYSRFAELHGIMGSDSIIPLDARFSISASIRQVKAFLALRPIGFQQRVGTFTICRGSVARPFHLTKPIAYEPVAVTGKGPVIPLQTIEYSELEVAILNHMNKEKAL